MDALASQQLADLEARHWWFRGRRALCMALEEATRNGHPTGRVLDAGAGVGGFLDSLGPVGTQLHHLDASATHLRACRMRGHGRGVQADSEHLPFKTDAFDLVCLFDVLEHLDDDGAALTEVRRVLRPGGRVLIHVPAHPLLFAQNDEVSGHRRRYTRRRLRRVVEESGLEVQRLSGSDLLLLPLIAPAVLILKGLEALGLGRRKAHTNLSWTLPKWADGLCGWVYGLEARWVKRFDLPTGHSLALVARLSPADRG
jgi:SAM-dependent methyltransferase